MQNNNLLHYLSSIAINKLFHPLTKINLLCNKNELYNKNLQILQSPAAAKKITTTTTILELDMNVDESSSEFAQQQTLEKRNEIPETTSSSYLISYKPTNQPVQSFQMQPELHGDRTGKPQTKHIPSNQQIFVKWSRFTLWG